MNFGVVSLLTAAVLGLLGRELFNGGFIVDFDLKVAFLDSPWAGESSTPIGILHGDWEELAGEISIYRPF